MDNLPKTENESHYSELHKMNTLEIISSINTEDAKAAIAVQEVLPQIEKLIDAVFVNMSKGGRLFYIGAGTSGRLGILDASECPPTFGVDENTIVGIIAGGDIAIRKAVEFAEDDTDQAWLDLKKFSINTLDSLIGIAASGTTPYVIGGITSANKAGCITGCITCNPGSPLGKQSQYAVEADPGPEFLTGSTRMKSGTVQKMILNMVSTSLMIKLGKVRGNKMTNMMLSNHKLEKRAVRMLMAELGIEEKEAIASLKLNKNVDAAINANHKFSN
ncbi:MAG: N-acetylmuramic acid 6-phosphate etherase [Cyclobacteriaceae bacterium]